MDRPVSNIGRLRGRGRARLDPPLTIVIGDGAVANTSAPGGQLACSTAAPTQRPSMPAAHGRVAAHRGQPSSAQFEASQMQAQAHSQDDRDVADVRRGAIRDKREITETVHTRPPNFKTKVGVMGTPVMAQTNYFRVVAKPDWAIHRYHVDFHPNIDANYLRRLYLRYHDAFLGGYIFDGSVMFSGINHKSKMTNGAIHLVTPNREGQNIQIKLRHVGVVEDTDMQLSQLLNLILRRAMWGLKLELIYRNFFDPFAKIVLDSYKMELWPGYQTSIRQHEHDLLLCCELTHKVMRTDTVYNILTECTRDTRVNYQDAFKKAIIGVVILTDYNNKLHRVDDVDFQATPLSTFKRDDGTDYPLVLYYKERYNIQIRDLKQPVLISRSKRGPQPYAMLIPELSRPTGLTDAMRNNFRLMKSMAEHTRLKPDLRIERLMRFNERLKKCQDSTKVLQNWNFQLDSKLVEVPARVLPPGRILFGEGKQYLCDAQADWNRQFRDVSMLLHVPIKRWHVIVPQRNIREIRDFIAMCISVSRNMGMLIAEPRYEEMPDDRNGSYVQAIERAASNDPQIVMPVILNINEEKYSCIKKKCCVDRPLPSQVVTMRVVAPRGDKANGSGLRSIATKVVIQMNAKLMGTPWMVKIPVDGLMTVGFDVCHSSKEQHKSFGALVAMLDNVSPLRFYSSVSVHDKGQELSNDIALKMTFAIRAYRDKHGCLPERILFYRDGVGDSQLQQVQNIELSHMCSKLDEMYKTAGVEHACRFAFIVVSKRINTRLFVQKNNPSPGTVVDDIITLPERYDFFLVSQSVRQGTVSPTNYQVLYDTMGMPPDKLQILTYKMTHLYYNWSGTTRVPAVCQYAHKLAFLVAQSIHRAPSTKLENQLFFL